jgi:hypothetical protein
VIAELANFFAHHNYKWKFVEEDSVEYRVPDEIEIEAMLDSIAETLYDGAVGDKVVTGRLIVEKQPKTHDVYVYIGSYQ